MRGSGRGKQLGDKGVSNLHTVLRRKPISLVTVTRPRRILCSRLKTGEVELVRADRLFAAHALGMHKRKAQR